MEHILVQTKASRTQQLSRAVLKKNPGKSTIIFHLHLTQYTNQYFSLYISFFTADVNEYNQSEKKD